MAKVYPSQWSVLRGHLKLTSYASEW